MNMKHPSIEGQCPVLQLRSLADRIVVEYDVISALTDNSAEIYRKIAPHISDLFKAAARVMELESRRELREEVKKIVARARDAGIALECEGGWSALDLVADQLPHVALYKLEVALADAGIRPLPGVEHKPRKA
jgi:hypothetical protein